MHRRPTLATLGQNWADIVQIWPLGQILPGPGHHRQNGGLIWLWTRVKMTSVPGQRVPTIDRSSSNIGRTQSMICQIWPIPAQPVSSSANFGRSLVESGPERADVLCSCGSRRQDQLVTFNPKSDPFRSCFTRVRPNVGEHSTKVGPSLENKDPHSEEPCGPPER